MSAFVVRMRMRRQKSWVSADPDLTDAPCVVEIDGKPAGKRHIHGEMHTGKPHRDLWATSPVSLTREVVLDHDVWLVSA
jgi:hypothetical protein